MLHLNLDGFSVIYIAAIMVKKAQKTNSTGNMRHISRAAKQSHLSLRSKNIASVFSADNDIALLVTEEFIMVNFESNRLQRKYKM